MKIKELKELFKEFKVLSIEKGISLICVEVEFKKGIVKFDMPNELNRYLWSFTIYRDNAMIYLNKEVLE